MKSILPPFPTAAIFALASTAKHGPSANLNSRFKVSQSAGSEKIVIS